MSNDVKASEQTPKVFISYSYDTPAHETWVVKLASDLVKRGIEVIFDQWDVPLGGNLQTFMEKGLGGATRVVVVCTEPYIKKSNEGKGGVGYEKIILTDEIIKNQDTSKFIPVVRGVNGEDKTPKCLMGRKYLEMSDDATYEVKLDQLANDLLGKTGRPEMPNVAILSTVEEGDPNGEGYRDIVLESTIFFDECFRRSFPGLRGVQWFDEPQSIVSRLEILLEKVEQPGVGQKIWWWGPDGDCPINKFSKIDNLNVVMDYIEIRPARMAAINLGTSHQEIVYLESEPFDQTGIYPPLDLKAAIDRWKYPTEEYAIFEGNKITREEYDDGVVLRDEKPVALNGKSELRVRHLTPWSCFIAPHGSPINNAKFDLYRKVFLEGIMDGSRDIASVIEVFRRLPKRPW